MDYIDARVTNVLRGGPVVQLTLAAANGRLLPPFRAGAHILAEVSPANWRAYSLCQAPWTRDCYRLVIDSHHAVDSATGAFLENLQVGQSLRIQAPREYFSLAPAARRHLLFGAGSGVAPLISMAHQLHADRQDFTLSLIGSSLTRIPLADELRNACFADRLIWCVDADDAAGTLEQRRKSRLERALASLAGESEDTHLYVCGPGPLIEAVLDAARDHEWAEERLHREHFGPPPPGTVLGPAFQVQIASSGACLHVPSDRNLADVLRAHGIEVSLSCGMGLCGTCVLPVKSGDIDHRDHHLDRAEREAGHLIAACCSRALGDTLVLAL